MATNAVTTSTNISASLAARLAGLGNPEAGRLVEKFKSGQISEQQFIASASQFAKLTQTNAGRALSQRASFFGSSPIAKASLDKEGVAFVKDIQVGPNPELRARATDFNFVDGLMK